MNSENYIKLKTKLLRYLAKKKISATESDNIIFVEYVKHYTTFKIVLTMYEHSERLYYRTPNVYPSYEYIRDSKGRYRQKSTINDLKTSYNRKDFNIGVYKNILKIQKWLDPVAEREKKEKDALDEYAKELDYYFNDKYGNVKISISNNYDGSKQILAKVNVKDGTETHTIQYKDKKYKLIAISKSFDWDKGCLYKEREKKT